MISIILYCTSVISILWLYYMYKPVDEVLLTSKSNNKNRLLRHQFVGSKTNTINTPRKSYFTCLSFLYFVSNKRFQNTKFYVNIVYYFKLFFKIFGFYQQNSISLNDLKVQKCTCIENKYNTVDELIDELINLNIFKNYPINDDQVFYFETNSLLNPTLSDISCNVILGIDFSSSNEWNGRKTFNSTSLHKTIGSKIFNPYQKAISYLGIFISKLIATSNISSNNYSNNQQYVSSGLKIFPFGFGDQTTKDKYVFSFFDNNFAESFDQVLKKYNFLVKKINSSGPTSFSPIIRKSIEIIQQTSFDIEGKSLSSPSIYILVIISDGFISNECDFETSKAIIDASNYPLSIVLIGVGDGPWDVVKKYHQNLFLNSKFDNFQFVDFNEVLKCSKSPELILGLKSFMKLPEQFKIMKNLNYFD